MKRSLNLMMASALVVLYTTTANAQERTIFLEIGEGGSVGMNIAHHPDFDQYYGGYGGFVDSPGFVWDSDGDRIQDAIPGIDQRAWNYNPNTGLMEVCSFNANGGGEARGLIEAVLDNNGFLAEQTSTILATVPGLISSQSMPAYDPDNDVFYSRDRGADVNIVRRSDGSLEETITLQGAPTLTDYTIGYEPSAGLIIVTATSTNRALAYDTNGSFVQEWNLDVTVPSNYRMGYTNGQLFVFDDSRGGWQGYDLGISGGKCTYTIKKSKSKKGCDTCPEKGSGFETQENCEDAKDCKKTVKTTINCPDGPGTCKIKAKKRKCS